MSANHTLPAAYQPNVLLPEVSAVLAKVAERNLRQLANTPLLYATFQVELADIRLLTQAYRPVASVMVDEEVISQHKRILFVRLNDNQDGHPPPVPALEFVANAQENKPKGLDKIIYYDPNLPTSCTDIVHERIRLRRQPNIPDSVKRWFSHLLAVAG